MFMLILLKQDVLRFLFFYAHKEIHNLIFQLRCDANRTKPQAYYLILLVIQLTQFHLEMTVMTHRQFVVMKNK